jgi:hypothetical protein
MSWTERHRRGAFEIGKSFGWRRNLLVGLGTPAGLVGERVDMTDLNSVGQRVVNMLGASALSVGIPLRREDDAICLSFTGLIERSRQNPTPLASITGGRA